MLRRLLTVLLVGSSVAAAGYRISRRTLPVLEPAATPRVVGTYHVHSSQSHDAETKLEDIAQIASSLDLDFVIVTDHNAQLTDSVVIDDIALLSYAEVSTTYGHLVQLGSNRLLDKQAQQSSDILDRVRNNGGLPIAAHPACPKKPWSGRVEGLGGFEIASFSASARRVGGPLFVGLLPTLAAFHLNPELALAQALDRDVVALRRWDAETDPLVVGLCGADAHGRILDMALEMKTWHVVIDAPVSDEPAKLSKDVLDAIRRGHFHCVSGLFGRDPEFAFYAAGVGTGPVGQSGDTVFASEVDALVIDGPRATEETPDLVLLRNGAEIARTRDHRLLYKNPTPGTYRVEVRLPVPGVLFGYHMLPVIFSNRIRVAVDPPEPDSHGLLLPPGMPAEDKAQQQIPATPPLSPEARPFGP